MWERDPCGGEKTPRGREREIANETQDFGRVLIGERVRLCDRNREHKVLLGGPSTNNMAFNLSDNSCSSYPQ
jgi:hypothetical protein